jgi:septal ring factor EnvC (AmiA/AmiB activator)
MRQCPYCRGSIPDDATRCQHCTSWIAEPPASEKNRGSPRETYIVDTDLIRFAKFASAVVAVLVVAGSILIGFDLKDTEKNTRAIKDEVTKESSMVKAETEKVKEAVARVERSQQGIEQSRREIRAAADEVQEKIKSIKEGEETIHGIVIPQERVISSA